MVWTTHTVFNQPKPLGNSNLFLSDTPLREALQREQGGWDAEVLASLGQQLGTGSRWSWAAWPTPTRRSCCAMTPPASGWTTFAFTPPGIS